MTSLAFDYERPDTVERAVALLATPGSIVLAGGQSLVPLLNRRMVTPTRVIDITRVAELRRIELGERILSIGAAARLADIEKDSALAHFPLLTEAIASTANPSIRNRATLIGNLVRANAKSELTVVCVALDATLVIGGQGAMRSVAVADFLLGHHSSAVGAGEIVLRVEIPRTRVQSTGSAFSEIASRSSATPLVCVAAFLEGDAKGAITGARVVAGGIAGKPLRCERTERALLGRQAADASRQHFVEDFVPSPDLVNAGYALDVLPVVIGRAIARAAGALTATER